MTLARLGLSLEHHPPVLHATTFSQVLRLLTGNVGHHQPWGDLDVMDVVLLQELRQPPVDWADRLVPLPGDSWSTAGAESRDFRTAIARVSDAVALSARPMGEISKADPTVLAVSRPGTLTAADVLKGHETLLTAVSMYAAWESQEVERKFIYADASAHRIISDLASLVRNRNRHRIIAAGDLNIYRGYGDKDSPYWRNRYLTGRPRGVRLPILDNQRRPAELPAEPAPPGNTKARSG